jgi:hypothetical protein
VPQPPQPKRKDALIGVLAGVVALAVVGGLTAWYVLGGSGEMEPYTVVMPQSILNGAYDKKAGAGTAPTISLTQPSKATEIGVKNAASASATFSNDAHVGSDEVVSMGVIGIYGDVTQPEAAVDAVYANIHASQEKTAKSSGLDVQQVEPVQITGMHNVAGFDGAIMKCETLTIQPKSSVYLDKQTYVSRCVWGDPSAVGIVQAEGKGFQPLDMMQTGFAATSKKIREEVRKSR